MRSTDYLRKGDWIRQIGRMVCTVALCVACLVAFGCAEAADSRDDSFGASPITAESLEGLILEGEGPIPARLVYQSRNTLSSEESRIVLDAIYQELDRLVDLAGRLDDAISDEIVRTDNLTP